MYIHLFIEVEKAESTFSVHLLLCVRHHAFCVLDAGKKILPSDRSAPSVCVLPCDRITSHGVAENKDSSHNVTLIKTTRLIRIASNALDSRARTTEVAPYKSIMNLEVFGVGRTKLMVDACFCSI